MCMFNEYVYMKILLETACKALFQSLIPVDFSSRFCHVIIESHYMDRA